MHWSLYLGIHRGGGRTGHCHNGNPALLIASTGIMEWRSTNEKLGFHSGCLAFTWHSNRSKKPVKHALNFALTFESIAEEVSRRISMLDGTWIAEERAERGVAIESLRILCCSFWNLLFHFEVQAEGLELLGHGFQPLIFLVMCHGLLIAFWLSHICQHHIWIKMIRKKGLLSMVEMEVPVPLVLVDPNSN